ncbi:hypothetical protein Nepgr_012970 [Nepenthes gracilis]|uniref:FAF domain-containing protein n=1 Tax=Nepenthes gracilis TaxID=150966 RepID=A0AAD3XNP1_NEPGR|nr:hypothetical protein Nepgr_012970 [Nepenthes gracilis]
MAACGRLQQIFEDSFPEKNPPSIDPLSCRKHNKPVKHIGRCFTEIFGELHFPETEPQPSSPPSPPSWSNEKKNETLFSSKPADGCVGRRRNSDKFSSMNSDSLHLCTEGLGFESLDDVEDLKKDVNNGTSNCESKIVEKVCVGNHSATAGNYLSPGQYKTAKSCGRAFPPPLSFIGRSGKPGACFKSYRKDGRFVLQEVRNSSQEYLRACREDGRLRLCFVQPEDHHFLDQEEAAAAAAAAAVVEEGDLDDTTEEDEHDKEESDEAPMNEAFDRM